MTIAPVQIDGFPAYAPELAREAPGYDPDFYAELADLEAGNFWFRARNTLILWLLETFFPPKGRYLEIGCGTGYVLSAISDRFPAMEISGSEIFVEGLSIAARRAPRATLFQMDARRLPFVSQYDVIGAFDVLEHIEEDEKVLVELHKALAPGGGVVLSVPQHPWLWSAQDDYAHHVRRYAVGELERKLEDAGFRVRWSGSFVSLLFPALILSRRTRGRAAGEQPDPLAEFKLPRWVNQVLLCVMQAEGLIIRAGIRFPIGGSRVVVAFKTGE